MDRLGIVAVLVVSAFFCLVPGALSATAPTRAEYVEELERTCKPREQATEQTMNGARLDVRKGRNALAADKFDTAATIFAGTIERIAKVSRPPADRPRLAQWFKYLNRQEDYLRQIGAQLHASKNIQAQRSLSFFIHNGNLANNVTLAFGFDYCSFKVLEVRLSAAEGGRESVETISAAATEPLEIYTIGSMQTTAEDFFGRLKRAGIRRLLDIRADDPSQLAGIAQAHDLPYLLAELIGADYEREPILAPSAGILDFYKQDASEWAEYERTFRAVLSSRHIEIVLDPADFATPTALLCTEAGAEHCHRRMVCEHLAEHWPGLRAIHL